MAATTVGPNVPKVSKPYKAPEILKAANPIASEIISSFFHFVAICGKNKLKKSLQKTHKTDWFDPKKQSSVNRA